MSSEKLHIGDYRLQAAGNAQFTAEGGFFTIYATGSDSLLSLNSDGHVVVSSGCAVLDLSSSGPTGGEVSLQAGVTGSLKLGVGLPEVGALATFEPQEITLSVGPPGAGASIKMTPTGITFKVANTSYEMTPTGVVEKVAATERKLAPQGHTMTAAESELQVAVQGVSYSAPMIKAQAEAVADAKETLGTHATDAIKKVQNGVLMIA
jgi:hypothetical protein